MQEDAQADVRGLAGKDILQPVAELVNKIVDEYAKANNLAIVFDPTTEANQHHLCGQGLRHHTEDHPAR